MKNSKDTAKFRKVIKKRDGKIQAGSIVAKPNSNHHEVVEGIIYTSGASVYARGFFFF